MNQPALPTKVKIVEVGPRDGLQNEKEALSADVKVVQARLRHARAKTTLDTYGHLWPDSDDSTRAAIDGAMTARADYLRTAGGA